VKPRPEEREEDNWTGEDCKRMRIKISIRQARRRRKGSEDDLCSSVLSSNIIWDMSPWSSGDTSTP
jgi:hypothetical protein